MVVDRAFDAGEYTNVPNEEAVARPLPIVEGVNEQADAVEVLGRTISRLAAVLSPLLAPGPVETGPRDSEEKDAKFADRLPMVNRRVAENTRRVVQLTEGVEQIIRQAQG